MQNGLEYYVVYKVRISETVSNGGDTGSRTRSFIKDNTEKDKGNREKTQRTEIVRSEAERAGNLNAAI